MALESKVILGGSTTPSMPPSQHVRAFRQTAVIEQSSSKSNFLPLTICVLFSLNSSYRVVTEITTVLDTGCIRCILMLEHTKCTNQ